ncbi:MAG: LLM class flavin-dependent oxidoreductase [Gammaproteobacteria bacterium]|nr:LLM class flavin-dependent oxidoreductase [Gammaproteobacteria bacterium]MBQ0838692.1 LLM class flavin-dependent oxidoreductase [Gammaproteobacteria bacterium]
MQIAHFTERPVRYLAEEPVLENRAFFGVSNKYYDREKAAHDYNFYLDEACYCEEVGFDAVALNEHHGNPFCSGSVVNIEAAILARITTKAKIVIIGNMLPGVKHPLRVAEELATIDTISRGRLVTGWVRGAGSEQFFNNANPAYNREMFNEAHSFIMDCWTKDGPWRYEGKHFHYRHVNPWVKPYQEIPQQWIPGVLSAETVMWCAEKQYPYLGLGTALGPTCDLWDMYADKSAELGYQAGPENFGYLLPIFCADTDEKAQEIGKGFIFGGGQNAFSRPEHTLPPGYNSKSAIRMLGQQPGGSWLGVSKEKLMAGADDSWDASAYDGLRAKLVAGYEKVQDQMQIVVGSPETCAQKIKDILSVIRPGVFTCFAVQGNVSDKDRLRSVELLGKEVLPDIRKFADEIGLFGPFDRTPGSVKLAPGTKRAPVVDREALAKLNLS